jgi:hypothetical protein
MYKYYVFLSLLIDSIIFYISHDRSCLDENKAFLSTADSALKLLTDAAKPISGWKGVEYRAAFPQDKPGGANFYPPDMNKMVEITFSHFLASQFLKYSVNDFPFSYCKIQCIFCLC